MTPAELAQSRGYRDIAKLLIDEGMYFIICDNNFASHENFIFFVYRVYIIVELFYVLH